VSRRPLRPLHRAARFFSSLRPGAPAPRDVEWARRCLTDAERRWFDRMSNPDQRHAVRVARATEHGLDEVRVDGRSLTDDERRATLAAALLHDVGKTQAGLRTYGRVVATLSGAVGGAAFAEAWQDTTGFTRKVGLYLRYPTIGSEMLAVAESHPWVVGWAAEHHLPPEEWSLPVEVGRLLAAADDEA